MTLNHHSYTVGWVCALPKELTAARVMLDKEHPDLPRPPNDPNTYTLGLVGEHNVVITCLPKGKMGNNPAASVAAFLVAAFPCIKFTLMVGIGGGIPPNVRLGDVVVSTPNAEYPGVVQWDYGKARQGRDFERIGSLNNPPNSLLTALSKLESNHELNGSQISKHLEKLNGYQNLVPKYLRPNPQEDVVFKADYTHGSKSTTDSATIPGNNYRDEEVDSCQHCDKAEIVPTVNRGMRIHYGLIASGNQVIKDGILRDNLNKYYGGSLLCVEMEAAGLMNSFPSIVIRGICDYADSHKNKVWQEHAAAVAAAFTKELLNNVPRTHVEGEPAAKETVSQGRSFSSHCTELDFITKDLKMTVMQRP
jgi:nucleoside phosphorylase